MQQISQNLSVLSVGEQITPDYADYLKIFLSGSIAFNEKADWQQKFINVLAGLANPEGGDPTFSKYRYLILNPKAPLANPEISLANQEFVSKTQWEIQTMQQADGIFCNFLKKSQNPSALNGFLMNVGSGKIVVRSPQDYAYYPFINLVSIQYQAPLLGESGTVKDVMSKFFEYVPKFKEVASLGL